jgi:hypothetical protein
MISFKCSGVTGGLRSFLSAIPEGNYKNFAAEDNLTSSGITDVTHTNTESRRFETEVERKLGPTHRLFLLLNSLLKIL